MLTLLCGAARTGKTGRVFQIIQTMAEQDKPVWLVVPEQSSFKNERAVFALLGKKGQSVLTLSFSRMAQQLLDRFGKVDKLALNDTARCVLMGIAVQELQDVLDIYATQAMGLGFLQQLVAFCAECQNAGVTPESLALFSHRCNDEMTQKKLYELSMICQSYQAVVEERFLEEGESLRQAARHLMENPWYLKDTTVLVDDFGSFTAPEQALLEALFSTAAQVVISICSDGPRSQSAAFAAADDTIAGILRLAQQADCSVQWHVLEQRAGQLPPALATVEAAARRMTTVKGEKGAQVQAVRAANPYQELCLAAAKIAELVREKGLRYREIAVMSRSLARYLPFIPTVFARYKIPCFIDAEVDARSCALSHGLLCALSLACGEGDLWELAASPLLGLTPEQAGEMENYCFVWGLRGAAQFKPYQNHPDGLREKIAPEAQQRLAFAEQAREAVSPLVQQLKKALGQKTGPCVAAGVWTFLENSHAAQHLQAFGEELQGQEREEFFAQQTLLWDQLMDFLDLLAAIPPEIQLEPKRSRELLELAFAAMKVATLPRSLDEVAVGAVERMRADEPKAVLILGAVAGEFPAVVQPSLLLNDRERRLLGENGLCLIDGRWADNHESMLCYRALTAASDFLYLSAPSSEMAGEPLTVGAPFHWVEAASLAQHAAIFPLAQTDASALLHLAGCFTRVDSGTAALHAACVDCGEAPLLASLAEAANPTPQKIEDSTIATRLFGREMRLSPSRLERYYGCPFAYFLQGGLGLRPRRRAELSALEAGSLIHAVLEAFVSRYPGAALEQKEAGELAREVATFIETYLAQRLPDGEGLGARAQKSFARLGDWLCRLLKRLGAELAQSLFTPVAFELEIAPNGEAEPMRMRTPQGGVVWVEGTVDRVDRATIDGKQYIRVVDYKSGGKSFDLWDVYYGLNMQMLLYLFTLSNQSEGAFSETAPAGVLYQPALGKYQTTPRVVSEEKLEQEQAKQYRANGLLLDDPVVLKAMEAQGQGLFIPYKEGKEGQESLANLAELGRLSALIARRVQQMADRLCQGEIPVLPATKGEQTPCSYCDYKTACGFEAGHPTRAVEKLNRDRILEEEQADDNQMDTPAASRD